MKFLNLISDLTSIKRVDEWIETIILSTLYITIAKSETKISSE